MCDNERSKVKVTDILSGANYVCYAYIFPDNVLIWISGKRICEQAICEQDFLLSHKSFC